MIAVGTKEVGENATERRCAPISVHHRRNRCSPSSETSVHHHRNTHLRAAKPDEYGLLHAYGDGNLDVAVGRGSIKRALRIMARVLKSLEERGHKSFVDPQQRRRTTLVRVDGENLAFRLRELACRRDHVITEKEREDLRRWPSWSLPKWDYYPSGNLVLEITSDGVWGVKTRWKEGKRARLGQQVNPFIEGLEKAVQSIKERRAERERQRLEWEENARREEALRLRKQEEERRLQELRQQAANWRQSRLIREFVDEVRRQGLGSGDKPDQRLEAWVTWAIQHAEDLDPTERILAGLRPRPAVPGGTGGGASDVTGEAESAVAERKGPPEGNETALKSQTLATAARRRTFDRTVLYQQVWSRPVQAVAKEYGISGRGLAKVCARLRVPVPPRGYWAIIRSGRKKAKPPLPASTQPRSIA